MCGSDPVRRANSQLASLLPCNLKPATSRNAPPSTFCSAKRSDHTTRNESAVCLSPTFSYLDAVFGPTNEMTTIIVLYVDDDADDRALFVEGLRTINSGAECILAVDGMDALHKLKNGPLPDCIFIDINMPRMDGLSFLSVLKKDPVYSKIKTFILSTALSGQDQLTARRFGITDCLLKPTTILGLQKLLRSSTQNL